MRLEVVAALLAWAAPWAVLGSTCTNPVCNYPASTYIGFVHDAKPAANCLCQGNPQCDCFQYNPTIYCFQVMTFNGTTGVLAMNPDTSGKCEGSTIDCRMLLSVVLLLGRRTSDYPVADTNDGNAHNNDTSPGTTPPAPTPVLTTDGPTSPSTTQPAASTTPSPSSSSSLQTWQIGLIIGSGVLILGVLCTLCCLWRSNRERIEQHENIEDDEEFYRENYQTNKLRSSDMHQYHQSSGNLSRSAARADSGPPPMNTTYADETYSAIINGNDLYSRRGSNGSLPSMHPISSPAQQRPADDAASTRASLKALHPLVDI
ncbi:hypothetical protein ACHHYP_09076 [Achlya hypogyna]|uniref:Secreted protein n=1 Tax=Achlya hypogyna TaxID=1202772 RepID=A0A1V9ZJK8_ACHHY|nr:hypothetical protein ACHHYP_09076 [Achlya hypogyna]